MSLSNNAQTIVSNLVTAIQGLITDHSNITGNSNTKGHVQAGGNPQDINTTGSSASGTDNGYYARADHVHKISTASTNTKGIVQAGGNPQDINTSNNSSAGTDNGYYARADHVHKIATASTSSKGIVQLDSTPTANSNNAVSSGGVKNYIDNLPGGSAITKTSDLSNDGSDGQHPFLDTSDLLDLIYPVGSIYMSVNSTSPVTLFGGGTWERLQDRFLVGASDTVSSRAAGKTGGSETVTLTENQMPSHTHIQNAHTHIQDAHTHTQSTHAHKAKGNKFITSNQNASTGSQKRNAAANSSGNYYWQSTSQPTISAYDYTADATPTNSDTTATNQNTAATNQNTGGGAAHDNMPPYLAVYMWKRIL